MMYLKKIFLLSLMVIACQKMYAQTKPNDETINPQKVFKPNISESIVTTGKVKKITLFQYSGKKENEAIVKDELYNKFVFVFNEKGDLLLDTLYNTYDNTIAESSRYIYKNDLLSSQVRTIYDTNGKIKYEYTYEEYLYASNEVSINRYNGNKELTYSYAVTFDDNGKKLIENIHNIVLEKLSGKRNKREVQYFYDKNGMLEKVLENHWKGEAHLQSEELLTPDANGNPIEVTKNNLNEKDEIFTHKYEYEYDANQNWVKQVSFFHHGGFFINLRYIEYW